MRKPPIEGLSDEFNAITRHNLYFSYTRRQVRDAFKDVQQGLDHCLFKWYERNLRGLEIFCKSWMPKPGIPIKTAVCFCHGYSDTCTFFFEARLELRGLPRFILGQSMGGAVTLKVHLKEPNNWDGVLLVASMCKVADNLLPPDAILKVLTFLSKVIPKTKLFPQQFDNYLLTVWIF